MVLLLISLAFAEAPLPSYADELSRVVEHRIQAHIDSGDTEAALAEAARFRTGVGDTPQIAYLVGLIHNRAGQLDEAKAAYRKSLELNDTLPETWYDLGEILLVEAEFDEAGVAFEHASALYTSGKDSWRSPLREAEVAGHQREALAFEAHLKVALHRGFSFRDIEGQPQWQTFYADPVLRDPLTKLVTVYGRTETLDTLVPPEHRPVDADG